MLTSVMADVDTGVDDALALLFLVRHPALSLLAVTCVAGNTHVDQVVRNTLNVLHAAGAGDVPVARGAEQPLIEAHRSASQFHGEDGLAGLTLPKSPHSPVEFHAVELMRRTIINSPVPITLMASGPLTNVAMLIRMYPKEVAMLDRIVVMGGSAGVGNASPVAEFNVWHDPEAAAIVFAAPVPVVMYGLDVFYDVAVSADDCLLLQASPDAATQFAGALLNHSAQVAPGDPRIAPGGLIGDAGVACYLAEPSLVKTMSFPTSVELSSGSSRGQTIVDRRGTHGEQELHGNYADNKEIDVAMSVNAQEMTRLFMNTILGEGLR